jgi:hypothetical protein
MSESGWVGQCEGILREPGYTSAIAEARATEIPAPSTERLARQFAPQFEACDRVLDVVWRDRPTAVRRVDHEPYQVVLLLVLGRAISTYRAVLLLCRQGLPTQGLMLCRSLYEDLIAAYWTVLPENREIALERVQMHERHHALLMDDVRADFGSSHSAARNEDDERASLDELFAGGTKSWFGRLSTARKAIEPLWLERGGGIETLDFFDRYVHKTANASLHNTGSGLFSGPRTVRDTEYVYPGYGQTVDVDERLMSITGLGAGHFLCGIADLVFDEFGIATDEVSDAALAVTRATIELTPSKRKNLGRNGPCWCGSGTKLKNCHGE